MIVIKVLLDFCTNGKIWWHNDPKEIGKHMCVLIEHILLSTKWDKRDEQSLLTFPF